MKKRLPLLIAFSALTVTAACQSLPQYDQAQYWQRINASEAAYMRGQKAQQILNRDIARCVTELRELERLGQLKGTIPSNVNGRVIDSHENNPMKRGGMGERDAVLWAEHSDYFDFESCMSAKGWERTTTIPYDVAAHAERTYKDNHLGYKQKREQEANKRQRGTYSDLNN